VHPENRTILLVSPFVPHPPARGVELRIARLIRWMHREGYRVILVIPTESIDDDALVELRKVAFAVHWTRPAFRTRLGVRFPYLRALLWEPLKKVHQIVKGGTAASSEIGVNVDQEPDSISATMNSERNLGDAQSKGWFASESLLALVSKLVRRYHPRAVIVEYIFTVPIFRVVPQRTLKIVDTIDVFSRKADEVLAYGIADSFACSVAEERSALLQANVIVAIQSREARLLKELVPEREVIIAGMDLDVVSGLREEDVIPDTIVVVASDNALNVHGLSAFLAECWPSIKKAHPMATLHVVGKVGDACRVDDRAIRYSGWIDELDTVYREASVVINPTVAGTGLKIKSVQALAHGKPLVAWPNGVEGLDYVGEQPFRECRSWQEFADAIVLLLKSDVERQALAAHALAYARREFASDKVYANLRACLERGVSHGANADGPAADVKGRFLPVG
jgi:glycosyltransferase involved in cell wall biosynthesis